MDVESKYGVTMNQLIEITGTNYTEMSKLSKALGLQPERIGSKTVLYPPSEIVKVLDYFILRDTKRLRKMTRQVTRHKQAHAKWAAVLEKQGGATE